MPSWDPTISHRTHGKELLCRVHSKKTFQITDGGDEVERNYETLGIWEEEDCLDDVEQEFETAEVEPAERTSLNASFEYIRRWMGRTKLHIIPNTTATNAYRIHKESGLVHIFMHISFFECIRQWSNFNITRCSYTAEQNEITIEELYAYVGFQIAA